MALAHAELRVQPRRDFGAAEVEILAEGDRLAFEHALATQLAVGIGPQRTDAQRGAVLVDRVGGKGGQGGGASKRQGEESLAEHARLRGMGVANETGPPVVWA